MGNYNGRVKYSLFSPIYYYLFDWTAAASFRIFRNHLLLMFVLFFDYLIRRLGMLRPKNRCGCSRTVQVAELRLERQCHIRDRIATTAVFDNDAKGFFFKSITFREIRLLHAKIAVQSMLEYFILITSMNTQCQSRLMVDRCLTVSFCVLRYVCSNKSRILNSRTHAFTAHIQVRSTSISTDLLVFFFNFFGSKWVPVGHMARRPKPDRITVNG